MIDAYIQKEKKLILFVLSSEVSKEDVPKLKRIFTKHLSNAIGPYVIIGYHEANTFFVDKDFSKEMGIFISSHKNIVSEVFVTDLQGIQNLVFRLAVKFATKEIKFHATSSKDVEQKFDISIQPPYSEFQLLTE